MSLPLPSDDRLAPILAEAKGLFQEIQQDYDERAAACGFNCDGCDGRCCEEHFHHHTLLEYALLREWFLDQPAGKRREFGERARQVLLRYCEAKAADREPRVLCPLNERGRCLPYPNRPLICRLHGIAHVHRIAGRDERRGGGCRRFDEEVAPRRDIEAMDRTPYYARMAALEVELRRAAAFGERLSFTVADMVELLAGEQKGAEGSGRS